ncbi:MAG TPA: hypothetical protein PLL49_02585 [Bacteroidales bacterium]|nr:hypothetical protein [Bacteroidales bacterium]
MKLIGPKKRVAAQSETIFNLVSNCSHLSKYMPSEYELIASDSDSIEIKITNIAKLKIKIANRVPFSKVEYQVLNDKNYPILLVIDINRQQMESEIELFVEADIPFYLQPMVKSPLNRLMEEITNRIKVEAEK